MDDTVAGGGDEVSVPHTGKEVVGVVQFGGLGGVGGPGVVVDDDVFEVLAGHAGLDATQPGCPEGDIAVATPGLGEVVAFARETFDEPSSLGGEGEDALLFQVVAEVCGADVLTLVGDAGRVEPDALGLEDLALSLGTAVGPVVVGRRPSVLEDDAMCCLRGAAPQDVPDRVLVVCRDSSEIAAGRPLAGFDEVQRRLKDSRVVRFVPTVRLGPVPIRLARLGAEALTVIGMGRERLAARVSLGVSSVSAGGVVAG
jgi:hypothetical protein